jgi:peptidoglycan/xylan/chitin deacetylase (PgdA/CDA1 family)
MLEEAVSTGLVTVGSHTQSHLDLASASPERAEEELRSSKALIEDRLGRPCVHLAPPWGRTTPGVERLARQIYGSVATDSWRTNRAGRLDRFALGRTPVLRNDVGMFFRAKSGGLLDGERLAYRVLRRGPWAIPDGRGTA